MIKLIKPTFFDEARTQEKLAAFVRRARRFSMGKECEKFERHFAKKQERKHALFVNSGSSANLVLLQALLNLGRLQRGDKIGFSALTWATNVMPIIQLGLEPVAIDCEMETLNISPATLALSLPHIKALFITNVLGLADDVTTIAQHCKNQKILLLEDNCESLGSRMSGKLLGNFGLASTFSFYVGHHLSTVEGGMVVTDDEELAIMLSMTRAHGWARNVVPRVAKKLYQKYDLNPFFAKYTFFDLAYNVRPTELQGFLGNVQLRHWDTIVQRRVSNFALLQATMQRNKDLIPLRTSHMDIFSNFAFPVICKTPEVLEYYKQRFERARVEIRPIIAGDMTNQPFYKKYAKRKEQCPNADRIHRTAFYFGNNPDLTKSELAILARLLTP